jgi:Protein of unknown function (DUF3575)
MFHKFCFLFLFFCSFLQAQTYAKINGVTALVLIPNIGIETSISQRMTFQVDVTASFWKSVNKAPLQLLIIIPEIRYHFNENYNGFYIGANIGGSKFKLQKPDYSGTDNYQEGYSYLVGATVGYKKLVSKKIMLDFYLGGGSSQAFYKGYFLNTNIRYENANDFNKSGEWIPYRGGVMISYKI